MQKSRSKILMGWIAVGCSTIISCVWAVWGIIENFHEGWYYPTLGLNLGLMIAQYLSPMLFFMGLTLLGIFRPRVSAAVHALAAGLAARFFRGASLAAILLIITPLLGLGVFYWLGRLENRRLASWLASGLPLLTLVVLGISPAVRVSQRINDGNIGASLVEGNGVSLIWAPYGPGWPDTGSDWVEARQSCRQLTEDGLTLARENQDIWRLPTVEETVRSMTRKGANCGGVWDSEGAQASYQVQRGAESPSETA